MLNYIYIFLVKIIYLVSCLYLDFNLIILLFLFFFCFGIDFYFVKFILVAHDIPAHEFESFFCMHPPL